MASLLVDARVWPHPAATVVSPTQGVLSMTNKNRIKASVLSGFACCVASGAAMATPTFTTVNAASGGEKNHAQMLSDAYGGTWNKGSNGRDYSSSTLSAMRLADAGVVMPTSLTTGVSGTDNAWTGPASTTIVAKSKYAADNSVFGYFDDSGSDHSFHTIFNTSSFDSPATVNMPAAFRWALKDTSTGKTFTSRKSDNVGVGQYNCDTYDQLVTYKITDSNGGGFQWALFWEDRVKGQNSDYDFNDAMITISASPAVPAPGAAVLGFAGLGLLAKRRRK